MEMKVFALSMMAIFAFVGSQGLAQDKMADDVSQERDIVTHRDGSYSFKSMDARGNDVTVVVEPRMPLLPDLPQDDPDHPDYIEETDADDIAYFAAKPGGGGGGGQVNVNVYVFGDEEFRAANGNWTKKAGGIVEKADNAYGRDQNINWTIVGYYDWSSNGRNASQLLSDLSGDSNFVGDGLVMGFTADPNFEAGGIAYIYNSNPGTGVSICVDQGTTWTAYALRHEAGHNYGCSHDFDPVVCLMNYTYAYSIDYFDSAHESLISSHRNWFQ
jgi:hypothetical protein